MKLICEAQFCKDGDEKCIPCTNVGTYYKIEGDCKLTSSILCNYCCSLFMDNYNVTRVSEIEYNKIRKVGILS